MDNLNRAKSGFTLLELMISMAILGVMISVAVPAFQNYKLNAKRAESYSNLKAIAEAEKARYAEFGSFVDALAEPLNAGFGPDTKRYNSDSVAAEFSHIGWAPEGMVYYSYDVVTDGSVGASCASCDGGCFTATAYGDLDGDGANSLVLYAQADNDQNFCNVWLQNNVSPPIRNGHWVLNQVTKIEAFSGSGGEPGVDDF